MQVELACFPTLEVWGHVTAEDQCLAVLSRTARARVLENRYNIYNGTPALKHIEAVESTLRHQSTSRLVQVDSDSN